VVPPGAPVQQVVQVNIPEPKKGNALAIASLVLGILATLVCWIPFLGLLAIPSGLLGLLLGAIAVTLVVVAKRRGLAAAVVGSGLSVLAMILSVAITGTVSQGISEGLKRASSEGPLAHAGPVPNGAQPEQKSAPAPAAPQPPGRGVAPLATPPPAKPELEAVAFPEPARLGNVEVRVVRVVRGKVPLRDRHPFPGQDGRGVSKDELLSVYVEVKNLDDGRKLDYQTFAGDVLGRSGCGLIDDLGNRYRGVGFGFSSTPDGRTESESIYPGKAVGDHLVFEVPVEKASFLILELQAKRAALDAGVFRFKIPTTAIQLESADR
jgi:hypothetical protein